MRVSLRVNGSQAEADCWGGEALLYALREQLGVPGSKNACEQGECGSCSVLLDGVLVCSCLVLAAQAGVRAVEALPMRLRDEVVGALNLFRARPGPLSAADLRIGQALADVATIGLLQERNVRRSEVLAGQLQAALNSRVVIEQAKGKLAERLGLDMDQAFALLREYAHHSHQRLTDVARNFVASATADFPPAPRG